MINKSEILARFSKVYQSGTDQYQCLCPVHNDKNASLGIKFQDDKVIMHCFAGCQTEDILKSIGLTWNDIMPNSVDDDWKPSHRIKFNPYAVLKSMQDDYLYIMLSAIEIRKGNQLTEEDMDKLDKIAMKHKEIYEYLK